jgi:hypothetical protein
MHELTHERSHRDTGRMIHNLATILGWPIGLLSGAFGISHCTNMNTRHNDNDVVFFKPSKYIP